MAIKIFNTLTKKKENFIPSKDMIVKIYVCGPTVYDYDHLGHARIGVFYDVVRRYLGNVGYDVKFAQNITDVGHMTDEGESVDKIEKKAALEKKSPQEIARFFEKEHFKDMKALNVMKPDFSPRATEYIDEIINFIEVLVKKGYAYQTKSGVYFDVSKFKDYGKLSGRNFGQEKIGTRIKIKEDKKNPQDFALWKIDDPKHIMQWDSPWGRGYPGWHIECSVMNNEIFGDITDIHGGAIELSFPHHENEIAQSESYTGKEFVRYWMHIGLVTVSGVKMSKSKNNFITIKDLLKKFNFNLIRLTLLSTFYRKPFDYQDNVFKQKQIILDKFKEAKEKAKNTSKKDNEIFTQIKEAMNDDFNTPLALQIWFNNRTKISKRFFNKLEDIFGLKIAVDKRIPLEIRKLIKKRIEARLKKDWKLADEIRGEILTKGYIVEDTDKGTNVFKK